MQHHVARGTAARAVQKWQVFAALLRATTVGHYCRLNKKMCTNLHDVYGYRVGIPPTWVRGDEGW